MPEIIVSKVKKRKRKWSSWLLGALILLVALSSLAWIILRKDTSTQQASQSMPDTLNLDTSGTSDVIVPRRLKQFTGAEFISFYNSFAYPNVREFEASPLITGNRTADERIRKIALERGYIGRSVAVPPLTNVGDSYQLQERAANAWKSLSDAAKKDGQLLTLTADFRTIEDQRKLFTDALSAAGATTASIADGKSDEAINSVLRRVSVPGYTRHHSGYTVDIGCANNADVVFGASSCFRWLSRNNYENAKKHGWIPAYPEGAPKQGPDPEEWEYCWVGYDVLSEPDI